jgi:hypothetical protein
MILHVSKIGYFQFNNYEKCQQDFTAAEPHFDGISVTSYITCV